jgi:hypothetical protein
MTTMVREICVVSKAANVDEALAASAVSGRADLASTSDPAVQSAALREEMVDRRGDLRREKAEVRSALRGGRARLRSDMHHDMGHLKAGVFRWGSAALLAQAGSIRNPVKLVP